jgi:hypothetical protein
MILFGERSLWPMLNEYTAHDHEKRPHQGKGHVMLFPSTRTDSGREGSICCRARIGGLLKYSDRKAA